MRDDPKIIVSDHLALRFQFGANGSVGLSRGFRQGERGKQIDEFTQPLKRRHWSVALRRSVKQFPVGNDRKHCFSGTQLPEPAQDLIRSLLTDVNADVRVQQIARLHHSPLRFCGRSFSRPATSKSSGKPASRSKARTMVPSFSRRTISSPRRKISTSLLSRRNCFGNRTA